MAINLEERKKRKATKDIMGGLQDASNIVMESGIISTYQQTTLIRRITAMITRMTITMMTTEPITN